MKPATALRSALLCSALAVGLLTGCSAGEGGGDGGAAYAGDYAGHEPLAVVGYPSAGSLRITQQVLWRLADGKTADLASLAADGDAEGDARKTAENWVTAFREGARGKVTADFYDEGSTRQVVVLYFHGTAQIKEIQVRATGNGGEDGWRVSMREPDPKEAAASPAWAPKTPGGLGSKTAG
ncbi:hypothetical protein [Streptomyces sp. NPDC048349]|uniref:hypothetical protein n=1 Tax=Streptomyces sp. NPDC048349 TaxID=3155486 RepID=UPI003413F80B